MVKPDPAKKRRIPASALMRRAGVSQLVLMTDYGRLPDPGAAMARLPRGSWIIFRDYEVPGRAQLAAHVQRLARRHHHRFIVAGDILLARSLNADGVHLPDYMLYQRRQNVNQFKIVTAACHSHRSLMRAAEIGVGAMLVSPVFRTGSHPDVSGLGVHRLIRLVRGGGRVIALGGISQVTAGRLAGLKLMGIAGITGLTEPKDQD